MCSNPKDWCDVGESLAKLEPWKGDRILEVVTLAMGRGWRRSTQITFRQERGCSKVTPPIFPSTSIISNYKSNQKSEGKGAQVMKTMKVFFLGHNTEPWGTEGKTRKPSSASVVWSDLLRTLCVLTNLILTKLYKICANYV